MTINQIHLNPSHPLERHEIIRLIKIAIHQREYRFASQVALDWLTEFPGDLYIKYWYGVGRAKEGHLQLSASILDDLLESDPQFLEALKARIVVEQQLQNDTRKSLAHSQPSRPNMDLFELQEWLFALSGETIGLPKRSYEELASRWGEELYYLQKNSATNQPHPKSENIQEYERSIHGLIAAKADHPLIAISHISHLYQQYLHQRFPIAALNDLVNHYLTLFPKCLFLNYVFVDCLMETGHPEQGVALLHSLAARDISAQVAKRIWQADKPFFSIWPHTLYKKFNIPIPAGVAAYLGLNQLPEISTASYIPQAEESEPTYPEPAVAATNVDFSTPSKKIDYSSPSTQKSNPSPTIASIQETFNQISQQINQPQLNNLDGRQPVYVILTANQPLQNLGLSITNKLESAMLNFLQAIQIHTGWRGLIYYVDEGKIIPALKQANSGLSAKPSDPWQIKHCLTNLDQELAAQGEMIGALLILGGNEVIPFHRLPNPVEDGDEDILSDNPYAARDDNYLALDWPIGRIPILTTNPQFTLDVLNQLAQSHLTKSATSFNGKFKNPTLRWFFTWITFLSQLFDHRNPSPSSFGYTAAAWRLASFAVFKEIGNPQNMLISPQRASKLKPAETAKQRLVRHALKISKASNGNHQTDMRLSRTPNIILPQADSGYFNLHGLVDSAEWFGQSDPTETGFYDPTQSEHPIALQPGDILLNTNPAFKVIFSEACFGANITAKQVEESLALSFLSKGAQAFVGSTATAYGSNSTPLIAADFLAQTFWKNLRSGIPAGEALRQAKLTLAASNGKSQNTLDAEDQKTIIAFILLGDPLAQFDQKNSSPKIIRHSKSIQMAPHVVCDRGMQPCQPMEITPQMEAAIKKMVKKYLPGMEKAHLSILGNSKECPGACAQCQANCGLKQFAPKTQFNHSKSNANALPDRKVVILKKEDRWQNHVYTQYARLTLDQSGRLLKISISK
ncbi:MAG: C25 family cysteine peptidase [Anaerolineales bacterium]